MAVAGPHWHCRWGELDLVLGRQQQLLVGGVEGRRTGHRDRHGLDALQSAHRRRRARAISCWRELCIRRQLSSCSGSSWPLIP